MEALDLVADLRRYYAMTAINEPDQFERNICYVKAEMIPDLMHIVSKIAHQGPIDYGHTREHTDNTSGTAASGARSKTRSRSPPGN